MVNEDENEVTPGQLHHRVKYLEKYEENQNSKIDKVSAQVENTVSKDDFKEFKDEFNKYKESNREDKQILHKKIDGVKDTFIKGVLVIIVVQILTTITKNLFGG